MHIIAPQEVIGDDPAGGVDDGTDAGEGERLVALAVQHWR
jgi:hypothetical protein